MRSSSEAGRFERGPVDGSPARRFVADGVSGATAFEPDGGAPPPDPEQLRAEAFEAGREAGRAELPWREAEALATATRALDAATRRVEAVARDGLLAQRQAVIALALEIARCILRRESVADPAALLPRLEAALAELPAAEAPRVRLAPADHAVLAAAEGAGLESAPLELPRLAAATLEPDPALEPGDARVVAGSSRVDARLDTILGRVRVALEAALGVEPTPATDPDADPATNAPAAVDADGEGA